MIDICGCKECDGYGIDKEYLACIGMSNVGDTLKYCKACTSGVLRAFYDHQVLAAGWSRDYLTWLEEFQGYCLHKLKEVENA